MPITQASARELARTVRSRGGTYSGTLADLRTYFTYALMNAQARAEITAALGREGISISPPLHDVELATPLMLTDDQARGRPPAPPGSALPSGDPAPDREPRSRRRAVVLSLTGLVAVLLLLAGCTALLAPPAPDVPPTSSTTAAQVAPPPAVGAGRRAADAADWRGVETALADLDGDDDRGLRAYARREVVRGARRLLREDRASVARRELRAAKRAFGLRGTSAGTLRTAEARVAAEESRARARRAATRRATERRSQERAAARARASERRAERRRAREQAAADAAVEPEDDAEDEPEADAEPDESESGGYTGSCATSPSDIPVAPGSDGDRDGDGVACES